jgi:hypothetical protein
MTHRWLAEMTTSVATRAPPREALAGTATRHSGMADRGGARGGRRVPARAFLEPAGKGWGRVAAGTTVRRPGRDTESTAPAQQDEGSRHGRSECSESLSSRRSGAAGRQPEDVINIARSQSATEARLL